MIAIQTGVIIFLLLLLVIICQDEYRKRRLEQKSAGSKKFWNENNDRRKAARINSEIEVLYEVISAQAAAKQASFTTKNISLRGINTTLNEKLLPQTKLHLQLNIVNRPQPIFAQGRIVWVKEISQRFIKRKTQRIFAAGIEFTQISPKDETALESFVNQEIKGES